MLDRSKFECTKDNSAKFETPIHKIEAIESFVRHSMTAKLTQKKLTNLFFRFCTQRRTYGLKERFSGRTFAGKAHIRLSHI